MHFTSDFPVSTKHKVLTKRHLLFLETRTRTHAHTRNLLFRKKMYVPTQTIFIKELVLRSTIDKSENYQNNQYTLYNIPCTCINQTQFYIFNIQFVYDIGRQSVNESYLVPTTGLLWASVFKRLTH